MKLDLGSLVPDSAESAVKRHLSKIHEANAAGPEEARNSTTEAVMVAIALCNRAYLPQGLSNVHAGHLWWRLDDSQRQAIAAFAAQAALGGELAAADRRI